MPEVPEGGALSFSVSDPVVYAPLLVDTGIVGLLGLIGLVGLVGEVGFERSRSREAATPRKSFKSCFIFSSSLLTRSSIPCLNLGRCSTPEVEEVEIESAVDDPEFLEEDGFLEEEEMVVVVGGGGIAIFGGGRVGGGIRFCDNDKDADEIFDLGVAPADASNSKSSVNLDLAFASDVGEGDCDLDPLPEPEEPYPEPAPKYFNK